MSKLNYATQRQVDDFCSGKSLAGYGYWVRVLAEPTVTEKHMTEVRVELAYGEAGALTPLGEHVMRVYPSTLDEFDTYLVEGYDPNQWVHVEAAWQEYGKADKDGVRKKSKKYKVLQVVSSKVHPSTASKESTATAPGGPATLENGAHTEGIDAHSGPSKPVANSPIDDVVTAASPLEVGTAHLAGSKRGQPAEGEAKVEAASAADDSASPSNSCPDCRHALAIGQNYCASCGERVGG